MGLKDTPQVTDLNDGRKFWSADFGSFRAKVFVQKQHPLADIVNFGYLAPYLLIFEEKEMTQEEAIRFSDERGFSAIAEEYSGSVVFVYPSSERGWDDAPASLFADVIANSRIHQYFKDGYVMSRDRFTGEWQDKYIRGAIFRTAVYGYGRSADHIANNLLKTVEGEFLWGPGEITPACVILEGLSVIPHPGRRDIPVVSVGNSEEVNSSLRESCDHLLARDLADPADAAKDFHSFVWKYKRWVGNLQENPDIDEMGIVREPGVLTVKTTPDNNGDDKDTTEHRIGYVAWYNRDLKDAQSLPTVLLFHGGGDSVNRTYPVPLFYAGGEESPLPELPFQAEKCTDRIRYVFEVNRLKKPYTARFEERDSWDEPIWGVTGDRTEKIEDVSRGSVLTIHYFEDENSKETTALASISRQGHDCRPHTCEEAWKFMSRFSR
ncbi:MAG: hypothetical protein K6C95_08165 [Lachnospiraceae bacterium]|nr:hypothetical protein [Lachnospiraceae bacterium]